MKQGETIPATGHSTKVENVKDATCTEEGYTGDEVCTVCGVTVKQGETIPAAGHTYKDGICTVCGEKEPAEHVHTYGQPVFVWADDNTCTASFTCVEGDDKQEVNCTVTSETTPATEKEDGKTVYTAIAEFEGETYTDMKTVVIPATGSTKPDQPSVPAEPVTPARPNWWKWVEKWFGSTEPDEPDKPVEPDEPDDPEDPSEPDQPDEPDEPDDPEDPSEPDQPVEPEKPSNPSSIWDWIKKIFKR